MYLALILLSSREDTTSISENPCMIAQRDRNKSSDCIPTKYFEKCDVGSNCRYSLREHSVQLMNRKFGSEVSNQLNQILFIHGIWHACVWNDWMDDVSDQVRVFVMKEWYDTVWTERLYGRYHCRVSTILLKKRLRCRSTVAVRRNWAEVKVKVSWKT